jgi:hypothetical protein
MTGEVQHGAPAGAGQSSGQGEDPQSQAFGFPPPRGVGVKGE